MSFVVAFDKPISQGNTNYPFVVMEFKKEHKEIVKIKLTAE